MTNSGDEALGRAEATAERIRAWIIDGDVRPGERLSEARLAEQLHVSRNTLREAFRMLTHENLLVRRPHAGVVVATPTLASILDIYRVRRMIEGQVLRDAHPRHPSTKAMAAAVDTARAARERGDWIAVGTANMEFHRALVALADSDRLSAVFANVSAELRLAFGLIEDPEYLHAPYLGRNARVLELHGAGSGAEAAAELEAYLTQSERTVVAAYAQRERRVASS